MNRRVILLGAGVVLVVAIVLAIKINRSDSSTKQPASPDDVGAASTATRPSLTPNKVQTEPRDGKPESDFVVREIDGVTVRDHRKDPTQPYKLPTETKQAGTGGRLQPMIVSALSTKLEAAMKECTAKIPSDKRGKTPRLETELSVDIKQGTMTVVESSVLLKDIDLPDGEADGIKQCFSQKSVGQTSGAGSHADATHYSITLAYHVPPPT